MFLICNDTEDIISVSEPSTCNYDLLFTTPLVCHSHAMLVYPTLNVTQRRCWDEVHTQYHNKELTPQVGKLSDWERSELDMLPKSLNLED